jgi:hypothetical protein
MRVVQAAALTAVAILLTSVGSAQGLGDAAARERAKRKAEPATPAKVYTEGDIGRSMAPVSATPDLPATGEPSTSGGTADTGQPATEGQAPAEGQPTGEEGAAAEEQAPAEGAAPNAPKAAEDPAKAEAEAQAKAAEAWRKKLDQARKEEAVYKDIVDKVQIQMNDVSGLYTAGRAANSAFLEENKQKLADTQARIAALEEEGRRNSYR